MKNGIAGLILVIKVSNYGAIVNSKHRATTMLCIVCYEEVVPPLVVLDLIVLFEIANRQWRSNSSAIEVEI